MAKLLFFSIGGPIPEADFYARLGRELIAAGHQVLIVTMSRKEYLDLRGGPLEILWLRDELQLAEREAAPKFQEQQDRIRREYDLGGLRELWQSDATRMYERKERMVEKTVAYFLAWERVLQRVCPDFVIGDFGGELFRRVLRRVAPRFGATYLYLDWSPVRGKFALHVNEHNHWDHLQVEDAPLAPEQQAEVDAYLAQIRGGKLSAAVFWTPGINRVRFGRLRRELWREYVTERRLHDHFTPTLWLSRYFLRLLKRPLLSRMYSQPMPGEKYVFLPLHDVFDAQITVRAPAFFRQEYLVDWVARSLPDGYKLYVKEHPHFIAKYPFDMYRKVAATPEVRLLPPYLTPHQVIAGASAIVTVNSTAGFEALLQHKPVVVCGPVSYRGYGATVDVDDIRALPQKIREALESSPPAWKIDRFLWHTIHASWPGRLHNMDPDNLRLVAAAIDARVRGIEHPNEALKLADHAHL